MKERNEIQNLVDEFCRQIIEMNDVEVLIEALVDAWRKSIATEREACAEVCQKLCPNVLPDGPGRMEEEEYFDGVHDCVAAIRARGEI